MFNYKNDSTMYENDYEESCYEDNYEMYVDYEEREDYSYDQSMYDACDGMEDAYWNID